MIFFKIKKDERQLSAVNIRTGQMVGAVTYVKEQGRIVITDLFSWEEDARVEHRLLTAMQRLAKKEACELCAADYLSKDIFAWAIEREQIPFC